MVEHDFRYTLMNPQHTLTEHAAAWFRAAIR